MNQFDAMEDEDDLYGGFNEYSALNTEEILRDESVQQAVRTSHGRRAPNIAAAGTAGKPPPTGTRAGLRTGQVGAGAAGTEARPMTAVRAAGFTRNARKGSAGDIRPAPPLEAKADNSPEEKIRALEKEVVQLVEESCLALSRGEKGAALQKAKEAAKKEKDLLRKREDLSSTDQANMDLTYMVLFNLANQYQANDMYQEALNAYQAIVKNKMFAHAGRLKVNMGNIYFRQKQFAKAIKFYRMALDQIPNTHKSLRIKIMQNIGIAFIKMGQVHDAITSFEHIMQEQPDFKTGFNLLLCYYTINERNMMKMAFTKMLSVDLKLGDPDRYTLAPNSDRQTELIQEVIRNDDLRKVEMEREQDAERRIKMAAKIIAPVIEETFSDGYDWCIDQVKSSAFLNIGHDLEIDKAMMFLKQRDFHQGEESLHRKAIESLKSFEKKDTRLASAAGVNLSFLHYLEGNLQQADKYADQSLQADRYNPAALVNKGNVFYQQKDFERARDFYNDALNNDSSCVEALYNLGLVNKRLGRMEEALDAFQKLHTIFKNSAQVIYQLADVFEKIGERNQAQEWYLQLNGILPTDPKLLQRLAAFCEDEGDKSQAFSYYYDSFRYYPANLDVIEWLGAYYIEAQFCEKAIGYFERAAMMQPGQVKWPLMIASCHRRSGNYQVALETYKSVHRRFPDNVECLKFLVRISTDLGLDEAAEYTAKLKKAEKSQEAREQRQASAGRRSSVVGQAGSRENSAGTGGYRPQAQMPPQPHQQQRQPLQQQPSMDYEDPLGAERERPRTAARRAPVDEFADEELDDTLLPE
ncbi:hypothetical protein BOX15_Mlig014944g2 [Macrostomum lignano]|nr:hypothetical protein BOX15_Mlig017101g1 [Macrostomum lignano]PAA60110.1 hypothetical protein BOX15_Mlig014944g1 [Macrostomum lignano]PAA80690.1 hypothetical protein BOX15_Mlig014944g2 [Macrostomum lignano]